MNAYELLVHEHLLTVYIEFAMNDDLVGCIMTVDLAIRAYRYRIRKLTEAMARVRALRH